MIGHIFVKMYTEGESFRSIYYNDEANIIVGDFGAATMYHMLNKQQQAQIKQIERRAFHYFIDDLLGVCREEDKLSETFIRLRRWFLKEGLIKSIRV